MLLQHGLLLVNSPWHLLIILEAGKDFEDLLHSLPRD